MGGGGETGWKAEYPDLQEGEHIDWSNLYDAVCIPACSSKSEFKENVDDYFDLPVFRDYHLLIDLIVAVDNCAKNCYLFNYDKQNYRMFSIAPWDMDATWGRTWDGTKDRYDDASIDFWNNIHLHGLFKRLRKYNHNDWNNQLEKRYNELRSHFFTPENLLRRFKQYMELFEKSGAMIRESKRWSGIDGISLDFEEELDYLSRWIPERIAALDKQYKYTSTSIHKTNSDNDFYVYLDNGEIAVSSNKALTVNVYTVAGELIKSSRMDKGTSRFGSFAAGLYIVNGKKIRVK